MEKDRKLIVLGNPQGGSTNVQSDWNETNTSSPAYIKNKPTISDAEIVIKQNNVTKGSFTLNQNGSATINLEGGGGGGSTQVQSNWAETDTEAVSYIQNKPSLATVATTGSYNDLTNTPTIPAAQIQSDWNESDSSSKAYIANKPSLATVATSGSYTDLSNTPNIPDAQIQSDWTQSDNTKLDYIKNKPSLATVATTGSYSDLSGTPSLANVATSGSYNDLSNRPSIPAAQIQSDWNQSDNTQLDYIKNKPTIPAAQVNSDWNAVSGVAQILNKPSMTTETLTFIDNNNVETTVVVYVQPQS